MPVSMANMDAGTAGLEQGTILPKPLPPLHVHEGFDRQSLTASRHGHHSKVVYSDPALSRDRQSGAYHTFPPNTQGTVAYSATAPIHGPRTRHSQVLPPRSNTASSTSASSYSDSSDITIHVPEEYDSDDTRVTHGASAVAWGECAKVLRKHDEIAVDTWKGQIDTLLVYAGLFSAAQIAFTIDSYKWLQEDPTATAVALQSQILAQLTNSTCDYTQCPGVQPFKATASSRRINTLWFLSVVLSLSAALIGILVKQWLSDYLSTPCTTSLATSRDEARVRQFRYQGLVRWRVPEIVAFLPVLLQLSTAFFLIGLVDLLWSLDPLVATIITVFAGASIMFLVVTTVLPTLRGDSPHRSPQAMAVYRMVQWCKRAFATLVVKTSKPQETWGTRAVTSRGSFHGIASWARKVVNGRYPRTWNQREKAMIKTCGHVLDHQIISSADSAVMDDTFLEDVVRTCIDDTDPSTALSCAEAIISNRAHGLTHQYSFPPGKPSSKGDNDTNTSLTTMVHIIADIASKVDSNDEVEVKRVVRALNTICKGMHFEDETSDLGGVYGRLLESLARLLNCGSKEGHRAAFGLMRRLYDRLVMPVDAPVLENIISYTRRMWEEGDVESFYLAITMAVGFATKELPSHLRPQLRYMLDNLESHLRSPTVTPPGHSLLTTLVDLAGQEKDMVPSGLIDVLDGLLNPRYPRARSLIQSSAASTAGIQVQQTTSSSPEDSESQLQSERLQLQQGQIIAPESLEDASLHQAATTHKLSQLQSQSVDSSGYDLQSLTEQEPQVTLTIPIYGGGDPPDISIPSPKSTSLQPHVHIEQQADVGGFPGDDGSRRRRQVRTRDFPSYFRNLLQGSGGGGNTHIIPPLVLSCDHGGVPIRMEVRVPSRNYH